MFFIFFHFHIFSWFGYIWCLLLGCWVEARVSACRWARAHDCLVNWFTRTQARRRECQVIAGWVAEAQTPQIPTDTQFSSQKSTSNVPNFRWFASETSKDHVQRNRSEWRDNSTAASLCSLAFNGDHWNRSFLTSPVTFFLFWRFLPWTWPGKGWAGTDQTMTMEGHWWFWRVLF